MICLNNSLFLNLWSKLCFVINILIIGAFLVQISFITHAYIVSKETNTFSYKENLSELEFPVIFKICVAPWFNTSKLLDEGYDTDVASYFEGISRLNSSTFGWGGHYENSNKKKSAQGNIQTYFVYIYQIIYKQFAAVYESIKMVKKPGDVLKEMYIRTKLNEKLDIPINEAVFRKALTYKTI